MHKPFFLGLLLSAALISNAQARDLGVCPKGQAFFDDIYNCGMNKIAVDYAQACSNTMMATSRAQGTALAAVMNSMRSQLGDAQNRSMSDTAKRLDLAIKQFSSQILSLQDGTDRVAAYTEVMVDFPNSTDDKSSPDCFNKNFHALEGIVDKLDQEIINSKNARKAALEMLATVKKQDGGLDTSNDKSSLDRANQGAAAAARRRAPVNFKGGVQGHGESDITGTEDLNKQK